MRIDVEEADFEKVQEKVNLNSLVKSSLRSTFTCIQIFFLHTLYNYVNKVSKKS